MRGRCWAGGGRARAAAVTGLAWLLFAVGCGSSDHANTGVPVDPQAANPVRIRIPVIDVNAPIEPLDLTPEGELPPPSTFAGTGWWRDGPEPGERGSAVIVGHVDSYRGPAVFFRVPELSRGAEILVDRADGTTAVFVNERVERHDKNAFPTRAVYGDTPGSELRLVTCGGDFDHPTQRYRDNVVAFARRTH
ncbi:class F sortase [Longimycelium tulufanense]|uniref:Class F sortase n=1 Tax=Longimycelium tulufanense TaxID=907463 RepID=A0A8J3FTY6_9PSEU|nr:class F sortase [Longimycelium tulufanense]GGM53394.1 class F sortase [Longimycelium tulufanense]